MRLLKDIPSIPKKLLKEYTLVKELPTEIIQELPKEARMSIELLDGNKYTREEVDEFMKWFSKKYLTNNKYLICGSYRRGLNWLKDVDLVVEINDNFPKLNINESGMVKSGNSREKYILPIGNGKRNIPVDIFYTTPHSWPFAILHFTGSKNFNIQTRFMAINKGYKLNEYGLFKNGKEITGFKTEKEILKKILDKYYKPEERNK